jgi:NitT/TauT family transport system substrate-binding protein
MDGASRRSRAGAVALLALALPALLLAGCGRAHSASHGARHLVVGASALRISLPVFVAAREGIFRRHGLDVEVRPYATAQPMMDDVALGRIDAGGYVAYPIVFMASRRAARPTRVVTAVVEDGAHRLSYVLARTGSGLHFPADAAGRRVGILPTVAYRRWLPAILAAAGVDPQGVTVVPVDPAMQARSLAAGAVDLMFTNDPMATAMVAAGTAEVVDDGPPCARRLSEPFWFGSFALGGALAESSPELAQRLVAALDEAIARVRADPAAARRAMADFIRPEEQRFLERYPDARYLNSREADADTLAAEVARERALGILDAAPPVQSWPAPAR